MTERLSSASVQQEQSNASPVAPNDTRNEDEQGSLLTELLYCISSFHAIVTPVSITMILSALAVVYINTDETRAQGEAAYSQTYEVFDLDEGNSGQNFAASVGNVFIMVSVICAMTFVIVVLYKYGCMKIFFGYMVAVTAMLLGYFTSNMAIVAIQKYEIRVDKFSFAYIIWNYAIVGVLAIFYNTGIPKFVTQGYLVTSSVVLAWQLSYFNDWTAWTLLVMLALYDLFAVLSPCGPLKALTQLMSRPGARPLPGLLYEASLPEGVQRPNRAGVEEEPQPSQQEMAFSRRESSPELPGAPEESPEIPTPSTSGRIRDSSTQESSTPIFDDSFLPRSAQLMRQQRGDIIGSSVRSTQFFTAAGESMSTHQDGQTEALQAVSVGTSLPVVDRPQGRRGQIALAIAKLYKLPVIDEEGALRRRGRREVSSQREYSWEEVREIEWTPKQLCSEVTVVFPERGGRIVAADVQDSSEGRKYLVYNSANELLRTFVVNRKGKVMQVVRREAHDASGGNNSIKLGLVRHQDLFLFVYLHLISRFFSTGRLHFLLRSGIQSGSV